MKKKNIEENEGKCRRNNSGNEEEMVVSNGNHVVVM